MNVPDNHRCEWQSNGLRCACPAGIVGDRFCIFHRSPSGIDKDAIVRWSQGASVEAYHAACKKLMYSAESPTVRRLREQMASHRSGKPARIASRRLDRQPGEDEEAA